ncbi:MAG: cysteine synthase A [Lentisphaeria bacterium]|nr:cysteine synthase A [Lentisphaeria bacterium]
MLFDNILQTIGKTPLVRISKLNNGNATIFAKMEFFNPGGSAKDRVGLAMIAEAEKDGRLKPGMTIIEPTSGNTGIGLALASAVKGYHLVLTMPETMSVERQRLAKAYGAEVVLTPGADAMNGAIAAAERIAQERNGVILQQFENPANPAAHEATTGPEIWDDLAGKVDVLVATVGTGGTLTGTARYLRSKKANIEIYGVEPDTSAVLSGGKPGPHKLQGIGAGFIPKTMDPSLLTGVVTVSADEAGDTARAAATREGLLVGISSGAALFAALKLSKRPEMAGKNIVVILPDNGERYLSTWLFE